MHNGGGSLILFYFCYEGRCKMQQGSSFLILTFILSHLAISWKHVLCHQHLRSMGLNVPYFQLPLCSDIHPIEIESTVCAICYLELNNIEALMKFNCALDPACAPVKFSSFKHKRLWNVLVGINVLLLKWKKSGFSKAEIQCTEVCAWAQLFIDL